MKFNEQEQKRLADSLGSEALQKLREYEAVVGPPQDWGDVKTRATVIAELHRNEMAAIELAYKRAEAVTAQYQSIRERAIHRVYCEIMGELVDMAGDQHPPHKRADMRKELQEKREHCMAEIRKRMEAALEAIK